MPLPTSSFKAYDIRGELGIDIDAEIAYRIGRAVAQHFRAKKVDHHSIHSSKKASGLSSKKLPAGNDLEHPGAHIT